MVERIDLHMTGCWGSVDPGRTIFESEFRAINILCGLKSMLCEVNWGTRLHLQNSWWSILKFIFNCLLTVFHKSLYSRWDPCFRHVDHHSAVNSLAACLSFVSWAHTYVKWVAKTESLSPLTEHWHQGIWLGSLVPCLISSLPHWFPALLVWCRSSSCM